jgi:hypothetical protein
MAVDQLTACLKGPLLDMEQIAMKLAELSGIGAADPDKAQSAALALATAAATVARDAALICSGLDMTGAVSKQTGVASSRPGAIHWTDSKSYVRC